MQGCDMQAERECELTTDGSGFCNPSFEVFVEHWWRGVAKYQSCNLIWCEGSEGGKVEEANEALKFISELFEDHLGGWAVAYNVDHRPHVLLCL